MKLLVLLLVLELLVEMGVRCKGLGEIDCFVELNSWMSLLAEFLLFTDLFIWGFLLGLFLGDYSVFLFSIKLRVDLHLLNWLLSEKPEFPGLNLQSLLRSLLLIFLALELRNDRACKSDFLVKIGIRI